MYSEFESSFKILQVKYSWSWFSLKLIYSIFVINNELSKLLKKSNADNSFLNLY